VIVGAGFAGLEAARRLRRVPVQTVLVDQHNHHVFTPFLYQVATALLEPAEVAEPVRGLLRRIPNADFRLGRATGVDLAARRVHIAGHDDLPYDYLILAAGSVNNYFGNESIAQRSLGLNDLPEALALRNRILEQLERAAWERDPVRRRRLLTFAVVGGGPTGVELAGALAVLTREVASRDFRALEPGAARIVLVEASSAPLPPFAPRLQRAAARALARKGVQVVSGQAREVTDAGVRLKDGRTIEAGTVVWAAGVRASDLAGGLELPRGSHGRVKVDATLRPAGRREVFVVGDLAEIPGSGEPLPMLAQVGIQSGRHAADSIAALIAGGEPSSFHYRDLGTMATIGRNDAVAQIGPLKLSGFAG